MEIIKTITQMKYTRSQLEEPVGFVPTMGYLHEGHLSLIRGAHKENVSVVTSIFVNPTQFGPHEDFKTYPRDTERDLSLLEEERCDVVFIPAVEEIYPNKFDSWIEVGEITKKLEGAHRKDHFRGVTTIVGMLFNIIQPTAAYFGQKDAQQAIVIKKMVSDLNMNLKVITLPTIRESDGLAMSSRNSYLNPEERSQAKVLFQALKLAQKHYLNNEKDSNRIRQEMTRLIRQQPLANIDYISIANNNTLEEQSVIEPPTLISLAVRIGKTRLIDNVLIE